MDPTVTAGRPTDAAPTPAAAPEVFDGVLDAGRLAALWADLATTDLVEIRSRGGMALSQALPDLAAARQALADGARAVQVRYRHDGASWIDTIAPRTDGARVVRVRVEGP